MSDSGLVREASGLVVRQVRRLAREDRGVSLVIVAGSLVALIGMAALSVDLGMLFTARAQAQRAADSGALAGAGAMVIYPGQQDAARAEAEDYAGRNTILGVPVTATEVTFPGDDVRVQVFRTKDRGGAIQTLFARILGFDQVDVAAVAAAKAFPAGGVGCVLPISLPDKWIENSTSATDPADEYNPPPDGDDEYVTPGYTDADRGTRIVLRAFTNPGTVNPSWYYPFRQPGVAGANEYRAAIRGERCGGEESPNYAMGDSVDTEPGAMIGPTLQGFRDLIAQDPTAYWNGTCVTRGDGCVTDSPRIRPIPFYDPDFPPDPGVNDITLVNFANLFVEDITGGEITGILLGVGGFGNGTGPTSGLPTVVKLVE